MLLAFHKPYGVLSQFTADGSPNRTLADFNFPKSVYSLGRLDADSEGLLLLSDESGLNHQLLNPKRKHWRTYWAQVEKIPSNEALEKLRQGVVIQNHKTLPARARVLNPQPNLPDRNPPIRYRASIPTCWIELELCEGKNRQVRKMTASIGYPTLRLFRSAIGGFLLGDMPQGTWREVSAEERKLIF